LKIHWEEQSELRAFAGHGVDYLTDLRGRPEDVVAVVRGFGWFHGRTDTVEVQIRPTDALYDEVFLTEAKQVIEVDLRDFRPGPDTQLSPSLFRHVNA
jgi:hypothetical protein